MKSVLKLSRHNRQLGRTFSNKVFDKGLKQRHKVFAASLKDASYYDYLREESANQIVDRLDDINKAFPAALEIGSYRGKIYELVSGNKSHKYEGGIGGIRHLTQCDSLTNEVPSNNLVKASFIQCDDEVLPFEDKTFDLVLSSLSMHWINDLPLALAEAKRVLKPDGAFIASMLGGNTLKELRHCFYYAEQERRGGYAPHTSPLAKTSDIAGLIQGAGFALPTVDVDAVTISYPNAFVLMEHLVKMGEGNVSLTRQFHVGKETMLAMASLYQELYGLEDGSVEATFEFIYMIGWSPHHSQQKPCKRGSATTSMKDIGKS